MAVIRAGGSVQPSVNREGTVSGHESFGGAGQRSEYANVGGTTPETWYARCTIDRNVCEVWRGERAFRGALKKLADLTNIYMQTSQR